ncbi:MAG TPA: hypothetical protein VM658_14835 [bacterium]|nr:hypothetical protein [bacterium]
MFSWLSKLGVDTTGFDRWQVKLSGLDSRLTWFLLIAAVLAGALWTWSSVRELPGRGRRVFLAAWQAVTLALLLIVLMQPAIRLSKVARVKDRVAVLLDTSLSMTLPSGNGDRSRADEAIVFFSRRQGFFKDLEDEFAVTYYGFDTELHELLARPDGTAAFKGGGTDLIGAVSSAAGTGATAPLAGMVVVSDGSDTVKLMDRGAARDGAAAIKGMLGGLAAPVHTVACGRNASVRDLAIVDVRHDDYGFVHNPLEVVVAIKAQGGVASQAPVIFKQGDNVLASASVTLAPGQSETEARLSFTPRQVGEFMFSVEIPVVPGELTALNNVYRFPLKILRDKVRILYIVGNPSWDERFLRLALQKNPSVDLVSFYILRDHWDDFRAAQDEVSLIPFPTEELFTKELDTFDLVIWQNFRGPIYMPGAYARYMAELNRFVKDRGGALLMIGGHRAFFGQGRLDPKLQDMLPVEPTPAVPNYVEEEFKIGLTDAGLRHPIMNVGDGGQDLKDLWEGLPALSGFNRVERLAPGGLALAVHPYEKGPDGPLPVIAVREYGAGRVMAVMTDYTWYWNFVAVGEGLSNKPYQRFWENAVRWLLRDPEMRLLSLTADKGKVRPGEQVTAMLEVLDETYNPTDQAQVKIEVEEQPAGSSLQLPEPEHYGLGKYRVALAPLAAGGYRLRASAELMGRSLGQADVIFEASEDSAEWRDVMPRPENLAMISEATGGKAVTAADDPDKFAFNRSHQEQVIGQKDLPVWDNWAVFTTCFAMLTAGWYFRRKWGLR